MQQLAILNELTQPQVRDLAWVAYSPNLLCQPAEQIVAGQWFVQRIPGLEEKLRYWDQHPEELLEILNQHKSHFLGPYFEQMVLFLLRQSPDVEIIAERLQVHHRGQTLGEFDLLFRDLQLEQVFHWELALKYYLGFADDEGGQFWWGPNANDRLDLKFSKTFDEQLKLAHKQRKFLSLHGVDELPRAQALVKGYLFQSQPPLSLPGYANPSHASGIWWRHSDIEKNVTADQTWVWLDKPYWLAPMISEQLQQQLLSSEQLRQKLETHFARGFRGVMLAQVGKKDDCFYEQQRVMVVANDWPKKAVWKKSKQ